MSSSEAPVGEVGCRSGVEATLLSVESVVGVVMGGQGSGLVVVEEEGEMSKLLLDDLLRLRNDLSRRSIEIGIRACLVR